MKKLTALTLSLAIIGLGATHAQAAPAKKTTPAKTTKVKAAAKPAAKSTTQNTTTQATSNIEQPTGPVSPTMRGELTTTISDQHATNLLSTNIAGLPTPSVVIDGVQSIATVLTPANQSGSIQLDTTLMDEFINTISPNARHYPPTFPTPTAEYLAIQNVKHLSDWIEPYAKADNASFDTVMRAAKLNGMARNLNAGTTYAIRASNHMQKALRLNPNHAEANFLLGMMLSESGGFNEGKKYLEKAASLGYLEAEQSLAQADLLNDQKDAALNRLKQLQAKHPNKTQITEQISIIENGGYYIWRADNKPLNLKPVQ